MKNIKKFLALALVIVSVLALAAPALAASNMYVKVSQGPGYTVNVRKTASASGTILTTLTYGSCVSADAASGGYHKVSFYNPATKTSYSGYIQEGFLVSSIPSDCNWISRYGTRDHKLTSTKYAGADNLQADLNAYFAKNSGSSYNWYPLTVDGYVGQNTVNAITKFQSLNNLTADGVAGNMTKEYLFKLK